MVGLLQFLFPWTLLPWEQSGALQLARALFGSGLPGPLVMELFSSLVVGSSLPCSGPALLSFT